MKLSDSRICAAYLSLGFCALDCEHVGIILCFASKTRTCFDEMSSSAGRKRPLSAEDETVSMLPRVGKLADTGRRTLQARVVQLAALMARYME